VLGDAVGELAIEGSRTESSLQSRANRGLRGDGPPRVPLCARAHHNHRQTDLAG
jgi:hypothetical protein